MAGNASAPRGACLPSPWSSAQATSFPTPTSEVSALGVHIPASSSPTPAGPVPNGTTSHGVRRPTFQSDSVFRPARRLDGRVLLGLGAGALSLAMLALGLHVVVPESQSLLEATRDLEPGAVVQAEDVSSVDVRVPDSVARTSFSSDA